MIAALLPLEEDCEMVLLCYYCKQSSTRDVRGTDGWTLIRVANAGIRDCCPECRKELRR